MLRVIAIYTLMATVIFVSALSMTNAHPEMTPETMFNAFEPLVRYVIGLGVIINVPLVIAMYVNERKQKINSNSNRG